MPDELKASFAQSEYKEAAEFFRQKINIPTETYKDLKGIYHSRAFAVAGAMRDEVLSDFRQAVDKAIASGTTLQEFRQSYNRIADKWAADDAGFAEKRTRKGYDAWRSKVIFSTNMATAYAAGREAQMREPDMKDIWTHARYRCMMDGRERAEHAQWNNTVLPIDDAWWSAHTPPNGWNCRCWKEPVSAAELDILKKEGVKVKEWRPTGIDNTRGIDEGWSHNVGEANFGNIYKLNGEKVKWLKPEEQKGLWNGTPEPLKLEAVNKKEFYSLPKAMDTEAKFRKTLEDALTKDGKDFRQFELRLEKGTYTYAVDTNSFTHHLYSKDPDRSRFTNMIAETIKNPQEIRAEFMKSNTGKVAIRHTFYSLFADGSGKDKFITVVFDANQARFVSWTAVPPEKQPEAKGTLIYRRKKEK